MWLLFLKPRFSQSILLPLKFHVVAAYSFLLPDPWTSGLGLGVSFLGLAHEPPRLSDPCALPFLKPTSSTLPWLKSVMAFSVPEPKELNTTLEITHRAEGCHKFMISKLSPQYCLEIDHDFFSYLDLQFYMITFSNFLPWPQTLNLLIFPLEDGLITNMQRE